MAAQSLTNPFSDFGGIIYGNRFVGRRRALNTIQQRLLGDSYGNLAIMGLPRIGKSSLAWQGIMTRKDELIQKRTIPIYFQSAVHHDAQSYFCEMVESLHNEIQTAFQDEKYEKMVSPVIKELHDVKASFLSSRVMKYFKIVRRLGYKAIYILDEFDSVQQIFDVAEFQLLRELSYNPDMKLCLVTCSRKTIQEIEAKNGAISNFYGTFMDLRLTMFDNEDMEAYWAYAASCCLSSSYKSEVEYYVGCHPYLLDLVNDYCLKTDKFDGNKVPESIVDDLRLQLWNQLESIIGTLKKENIFNKALQLILGPVYDVTKVDEEKLLKYGFIKVIDNLDKCNLMGRLVGAKTEQGSYVCFSDYFTLLLDQKYVSDIDYWPLWTETEKTVRGLIKIYIRENFSDDWETEISARYGDSENWAKKFERLKSTRNSSRKTFPSASTDLVDYTLTRDMYDVFMYKAWGDWFGDVFLGAQKDWAAKFNFLSDIRNPMAHNNREFIKEEQVHEATNYCNEIVRTIKEWEKRHE